MRPSQDLDDLLRRCTVHLRIPQDESLGTGFFVAPGRILTCAHVIETAQAQSVLIEIGCGGQKSAVPVCERRFSAGVRSRWG